MAIIACGKCDEQVDEAKAFCPACGNAMLEERKRTESTSFERADMTMHLGQTMYNQMLSDMGLNTSKAPDADGDSAAEPAQAFSGAPAKGSNRRIPLIIIIVGIALLFAALIVIGAAGVIFYLSGSNS